MVKTCKSIQPFVHVLSNPYTVFCQPNDVKRRSGNAKLKHLVGVAFTKIAYLHIDMILQLQMDTIAKLKETWWVATILMNQSQFLMLQLINTELR